MGVRTLVGVADGTSQAAAMYDSVTGRMIGPIWEADDAYEQIEAFQTWMSELRFMALSEEIGLGPNDLPTRLPGFPSGNAGDVRAWPDSGIAKLIKYWRLDVWVDDGYPKVTADV